MADFCLVSKRTLDEHQYKIFTSHFLLGADWKLCCRKLGMDRGAFFHEVYRIEQKLGRTFRELEPFALFPLDEYFNSTYRRETAAITPFPATTEGQTDAKRVAKYPAKRAA
jgi:hypothetical protein